MPTWRYHRELSLVGVLSDIPALGPGVTASSLDVEVEMPSGGSCCESLSYSQP